MFAVAVRVAVMLEKMEERTDIVVAVAFPAMDGMVLPISGFVMIAVPVPVGTTAPVALPATGAEDAALVISGFDVDTGERAEIAVGAGVVVAAAEADDAADTDTSGCGSAAAGPSPLPGRMLRKLYLKVVYERPKLNSKRV